MSIQREEITIKEFTSGTTLVYFSTHLPLNTGISTRFPDVEFTPTIIELNNFNQPTRLSTFDGENIWTLNEDNNYIPISATSANYLTGYSFVNDVAQLLDNNAIDNVKKVFTESMDLAYNAAPSSATTSYKIDYVFPTLHEIDDFYVNINIKRTHSTLDTLNIYNNLTNRIPTQDSGTGVVFGRLLALQTIKDSEGNNIKIPLKNVPIGIFNPSKDYPSSTSTSDNGDRIFLNIKETVKQEEYFNVESFNFDKNTLLRSASQFTTIPDQYKYITTTNDEGEFVIYDAPIGSQLIMFEVDLMKQGLTRDEIALNFFPFPPDDDAIIDQIPNFSFKQFPINVVPAWGTIQTGYTELDVVVNLDLRKWTTYFIPPVSIGGLKLEEAVANSASNNLKVGIRNMAKEGYPKINIKMATIQNDLDKIFGQQLNWNLEFAQIRNEAEYFKFGISILKLPANIYDPNAYRTNSDGIPVINSFQKGVWLSSYQLKIFSDSNNNISRMTGTYHQDTSHVYSHFNLTHTEDNIISLDENTEAINKFPYEKPWSVDYPNKYSIPSKPTNQRFISNNTNGRAETSPGSNVYFLDEPSFSDGDMVGNLVDDIAGGFGMMPVEGGWVANRIAHAITKNYMYKYEIGVAINEAYANGFYPSSSDYPNFTGTSTVINGEKYQRLECGYGYFCRPQGWPRVARYPWGGEALFKPDVKHGQGLVGSTFTPEPGITGIIISDGLYASVGHTNDIYNIHGQNPALALDRKNKFKNADLSFFRVIDTSKSNLAEIKSFVIPTFARLHTSDGSAERIHPAGYFSIKNLGEITVNIPYWLNGAGLNYPIWTPTQGYHTGISLLKPGETLFVYGTAPSHVNIPLELAMQYTAVNLPGNSTFNTSTNRFDIASYEIGIVYLPPFYQNGPAVRIVGINMSASSTAPLYWIKTNHSGGNGGLQSLGINTTAVSVQGASNPYGYEVSGMVIENDATLLYT